MHIDWLGLLGRFRRDQRGSIALLYGITLVPLIIAVGCAVDYSRATNLRAALQGAADAASVASVSAKSKGFLAAQAMTADGEVSVGTDDATKFFNGRASTVGGITNLTRTVTVAKVGKFIRSTVSYTANVPTTFMAIAGWRNMTISGSATSEASLPTFLDFYLMLDVSGSMGLPSTNAEQTRLAAINPDNFKSYPNGCTFACHFTGNNACADSDQKYSTGGKCMGFPLSRTAGNSSNTPVTACSTPGTNACIQLRADAVGSAVEQLLITANTTAKVSNQFRIGLYPFIQNLYAYFPLTGAISGSSSTSGTINYAAANLATQLDTGQNASLGSGGTHFENAFPKMNTLITTVGTGATASDPLPFVFLVTDGAQNNQTYWNGGWAGDNHATVINKNLCNDLKARGVTISLLYIPYQPIQNPTSFGNNEDYYVNAIIPNIPGALAQCASPGFFFTANTPADITDALNKMFKQALVSAHVVN